MNTKHISFCWNFSLDLIGLASLMVLFCFASAFGQGVPVRLSFKFILDAKGNRAATGNINTDAEVNTQVQRANQIFSQLVSEWRLQNLEIVDVAGINAFYNADIVEQTRNDLRTAAIANPALYHWRNDAVNIYISGRVGPNGAISQFPPNNDIVLVGQGCSDLVIAHEVGHSLNLLHTHQPGGDGCSDTLKDDEAWSSRDDIARNNFSDANGNPLPYASLNSDQKFQVDLVWGNVMSYHDLNNRYTLSPCQLNRISTQAYTDRNRFLSAIPVYVDFSYGGSSTGSFTQPYQTIQQAIDAKVLNNRALVLVAGVHDRPSSIINTPTYVIPRRGTAAVEESPLPYPLAGSLEQSKNAAVREAVVRAQQSDRRKDYDGAIAHLQEAEKYATGREKSALQLELAQRYRDAKHYEEAAAWFTKAAEGSDHEEFQKHARHNAKAMQNKLERQQKEGDQEDRTQ